MSHVVSIKTELTDLEAVKRACAELGLRFKENQKTYTWWGSYMGDSPLPEGFTKEDLGKCEHAIGVPDTEWEVGLARSKTGKGYLLVYDAFGTKGKPILKAIGGHEEWQSLGGNRRKKIMVGLGGRFLQIYAVHKATSDARKRGYMVARQAGKDGNINLVVTGV